MTAAHLPSPPPFRPLLVLLIIIACLYQSVGSLRRGGSNAVRLRDKRWHCHREDGRCVVDSHSATSSVDGGDDNSVYPHLEGCKSVCGKHGSLWPIPKKVKLSATLNAFKLEDIAVKFDIDHFEDNHDVLESQLSEAWVSFTQNLKKLEEAVEESPPPSGSGGSGDGKGGTGRRRHQILFKVSVVQTPSLEWTLDTERESYTLKILTRPSPNQPRDDVQIFVKAKSYFGAIYGLETMSQLVTYHGGDWFLPASAQVSDKPVYPYRGILLDTSRNFYSVDSIKRMVDGMGYNKLNVLHWHITDANSFPFHSQRVPKMAAYGAYSQREVYYMEEIKDLVDYSLARGVLLLPELDTPAHSAYGWDWGPSEGKGNLTTCLVDKWIFQDTDFGMRNVELSAAPPAGQLNPLNENVYHVLGDLYKDFLESFTTSKHSQLPLFHMGGDEVNLDCWARDPDISMWMVENKYKSGFMEDREGYIDLWNTFQTKAYSKLEEAYQDKKINLEGAILWSSELTKPNHLHKYVDKSKYVVQVWTDGKNELISYLLANQYRMILSNWDAWYLDCGFDAWVWNGVRQENNWCSPFKGWKTVYMNSPLQIGLNFGLDKGTISRLILGGEAALWSEQIDEHNVGSRLWPRGCALAERLWSDPEGADVWREAEQRLLEHRRRMAVVRGIQADVVQPEFCRQAPIVLCKKDQTENGISDPPCWRQNDGYCYAAPAQQGQQIIDSQMFLQNDQQASDAVRVQNYELMKIQRQEQTEVYMRWLALAVFCFVLAFYKRRAVLTSALCIADLCAKIFLIIRHKLNFRFITIH